MQFNFLKFLTAMAWYLQQVDRSAYREHKHDDIL